jgi:uncharacterized protein (TIGR00251 family)
MSCCWYRWDGTDLILLLHIQPKARKDEIVGPHGDRLKIRITAPPVDGKANKYLLKYLASQFGVSGNQLLLESGETGRDKRIRITAPRQLPEIPGLIFPD